MQQNWGQKSRDTRGLCKKWVFNPGSLHYLTSKGLQYIGTKQGD